MSERKVWVLDTETKGTGAHVVPFDAVERRPEPGPKKVWVPRKRRARRPPEPQSRPPRRFRVVDVLTREVLAEDADAPTMLAVLGDVERMLDVNVFVWEPEDDAWRLLRMAEQEAVWKRRASRP